MLSDCFRLLCWIHVTMHHSALLNEGVLNCFTAVDLHVVRPVVASAHHETEIKQNVDFQLK